MAQPKTNLALLLGLLGAHQRDIVREVGADKSLVSRWCNGKQKLMPGHGWIDKVADYMLALDERLKNPVIPDILAVYYPDETLNNPVEQRNALLDWLATVGHKPAEHQSSTAGLAGLVMEKATQFTTPKPQDTDESHTIMPPPLKNAVVYGVEGVQGSALQFIELIRRLPSPQEVWYACPEGLDMYTRDERFSTVLMEKMLEMFEEGHKLNVVLRTDYKMTDVSAFSGPWLLAHLLGYVKSHYFDDFHQSYNEKMLAVAKDRMAMKVVYREDKDRSGIHTNIYFDEATLNQVWRQLEKYRKQSRQRFHYELFERPDGFLHGIEPLPDRAHYLFSRLPHFILPNCPKRLCEYYNLTSEEADIVSEDFKLLTIQPGYYTAPVRTIFCEDDIEDVLLKDRHVIPELTSICGRRVNMSTQLFVDELVHMRDLLQTQKNYEVCFLPAEHFEKIRMQIACWGDRAAIGWVAGESSTACKDYTNVNALTGFCERVWGRIPGIVKTRRTGIRKLNTWLKKAEKYGYIVTKG